MAARNSFAQSSVYSDEPPTPGSSSGPSFTSGSTRYSFSPESVYSDSDGLSKLKASGKALMFDRNSVINATVYSNGVPSYSIITNKSGTRIDVCDISKQCVTATIKRRDFLADTVKFPARNDGNSVTINKWLKPLNMPAHNEPCTSLVTDIGNFVWKTSATYRLALYPEEDASSPVAFMIRGLNGSEPPFLSIKEGSEDMVEDVLVSFIVLEQRLRMKEKRRTNGMMFGPLSETGLS